MLRLKRYRGQGVHIGENIYIKIIRIDKDGCVELGISAPEDVKILRTELKYRMKENGKISETTVTTPAKEDK